MKTFPRFLALSTSAVFLLGIPASAFAASVTWDGGVGGADAGGAWETGTNWSGDSVPGTADNAQLLNVTSGTRTVTLTSGNPQAISQLTLTQTTSGAFNTLNVNDNLTVGSSNGGTITPFSITPTAGQSSIVVNIAAGKTFLVNNSGAGSLTAFFAGTLNLGAASVYKAQAIGTAGTSDVNRGALLGGPVNVSGTGAEIQFEAGRGWVGGTGAGTNSFNGAVTVTGSGSSLNIRAIYFNGTIQAVSSFNGGLTFNGDDGSGNAINLGADTQLNLVAIATTFNFNNRVLLAAASGSLPTDPKTEMTTGSFGGTSTTTANFNAGLTLGTRAREMVLGANAAAVLAGTSSFATGSELRVQFSGSSAFTNNGTLTLDGAAINFDYTPTSSNNGTRNFANTGTWTLKNNSSLAFISSNGFATAGFGVGTNNNNSGTITVQSGSTVGFDTLFNTGTLNLGSSTANVSDALVSVGSPNQTFGAPILTNGVTSAGTATAGTINILGNTLFGRPTAGTSAVTLNNGSISSTGSTFTIGDGTTSILFTMANGSVAVNNFSGNTLNLKSNATFLMKSLQTGGGTGNTTLTNTGTFVHSGKIQVQSNGWVVPTLNTDAGGTYRVSGTAASIERLAGGGSTTNVFAPTMSIGGLLVGGTASDKLTYTDLSGRSGDANAILAVTLAGGEIAPGNGTGGSGTSSIGKLELANLNVTTSGAAKLSIDIGGDVASNLFDSISLTGTYGRIFTLAGINDTLDIRIVNGFNTQTPQTYLILTSAAASGVVGTFDALLYNGAAVTNEYTVNYLANGIQVTFTSVIPEPSTTALLVLGGLGLLARARRRA